MSLPLCLIERPSWQLVFDLRCWAVGIYWDDDLIGVDLGPLGLVWHPGGSRFKQFCLSWTLFETLVGRFHLHLDVDANIWRFGYIMAAPWDHGLYLGPANLQIEYDLVNDEDD